MSHHVNWMKQVHKTEKSLSWRFRARLNGKQRGEQTRIPLL